MTDTTLKLLNPAASAANLPLRARLWSSIKPALALLLFTAALLKLHQTLRYHSWLFEPLLPQMLRAGQIVAELFLAGWLLINAYDRLLRKMLLITFSIFLLVSLSKVLRGETYCDCFGAIRINPFWTTFLNGAILALLFSVRSYVKRRPRLPKLLQLSSIAIVAIIVFAAIFAYTTNLTRLAQSSNGVFYDARTNTAYLQPALWLGRPCPILAQIDIGKEISSGDWTLVFYHRNCDSCRNMIPTLFSRTSKIESTRWVFIEVPQPIALTADIIPSHLQKGVLTGSVQWFVETPIFVTLRAGQVKSVSKVVNPSDQVFGIDVKASNG